MYREIPRSQLSQSGPDYEVIGAMPPCAERGRLLGDEFNGRSIAEFKFSDGTVRWFLIVVEEAYFNLIHDYLWADYRGNPDCFGNGHFEEIILVD
jgi:hypothetical protein